jgi:hypothetical protein
MIDTSMTAPEQKQFLSGFQMARGPDLFRGNPSTEAFVYTKHPDKDGNRYFSRPGNVGHEAFITEPEIVEAIFGPELDQPSPEVQRLKQELEGLSPHHYKRAEYEKKKDMTIRDELTHEKIVWKKDADGKLVQPLEAESTTKEYSWADVRAWGKERALFGRKGKGSFDNGQQDVIMLWPWTGPKDGWVPLLVDMLHELNVSPDAVVTMGISNQFSAGDFLKKKIDTQSVADNAVRDRDKIELLRQFHTATGANKEALKQLLGFKGNSGDVYPDVDSMSDDEISKFPWHGRHWQTKMQRTGMLAPAQKWWSMYGDSTDMGFSQYLFFFEMGLI